MRPPARPSLPLAVVLVLVVAAGCGGRSGAPRAADPMLEALRHEQQASGLSYAESQGRHLFGQYCATCHGDGGAGDGQNASNLVPPPPDLTAAKAPDPARLRRAIAGGSAAVGRSALSPPWGRTLSAQEIDYLVVYCQALSRPRR